MKILLPCCIGVMSYGAVKDHLINWCLNLLPQKDIDIRIILPKDVYQEALNDNTFINQYKTICFDENDFQYVFPNCKFSIFYHKSRMLKDLNIYEKKRLFEVISSKLDKWIPDIILTAGWNSSTILSELYPKALCLNQENALFSRPPYKRSLCYDVFHNFSIFPNHFLKEIKEFKISSQENEKVEKFKFSLRELIEQKSPISQKVKEIKSKFRKTVLLPLVDEWFQTYLQEDFITIYDFLEYVFQNIPSDVGVFVTEPDRGGILKGKTLEYFQKYPNFIFLQETNTKNGFSANSLHYLYHVDAIFGTPSKTALNALIYDKPVISLDKSFHDWIADSKNILDLNKILNKPCRNKNNMLYWYLTHYTVFETNYYTEGWLYNYLSEKLEKFRKDGITFDLYNQINSFDEISSYILKNVLTHYTINQNRLKELQELFCKQNRRFVYAKYIKARILSHITFGKKKKHYKMKKKKYKQLLKG